MEGICSGYTCSGSGEVTGGWKHIQEALLEYDGLSRSAAVDGGKLVALLHFMCTMALKMARRKPLAEAEALVASARAARSITEQEASIMVAKEASMRSNVLKLLFQLALSGSVAGSSEHGGAAADTLCAVLAANAASSGVAATEALLRELLSCSSSMPSLPFASVLKHLGIEAQSASCPERLESSLRRAAPEVLGVHLLRLLVEGNEESGDPKLASTAISAAQYWSEAADFTVVDFMAACGGKLLEAVAADSLYSSHQVRPSETLLSCKVSFASLF